MDPQTRVGDAEREQTVAALQQYVTDGYLTLDEFSERSAAAYRARTSGELAVITADLAPRSGSALAARPTGGGLSRISWTPVAIVVAAVVGLVVLAGVVVVLMMLGMMGGMMS
jgi:hypothetical protein